MHYIKKAAEPKVVDDTDYSNWFAVIPADDCPHTHSDVRSADQLSVDGSSPCATCGSVGENMLCLSCREVHCGRHVAQHMLAHHEKTGHPLVCGFVDLSFWCYECDQYINSSNPRLWPYYAALHAAKFGGPPPGGPPGWAARVGAAVDGGGPDGASSAAAASSLSASVPAPPSSGAIARK